MNECDCSDYKLFMCWDCAACTNCIGEYYMVHDDLWEAATEDCYPDVMLCIGCLEARLGELLTKDDFTAAPLNSMNLIMGSTRLKDRLTKVVASATF